MLLNSAILLHVPALYFIDYCQLFYDTRMVWTFKIFAGCAALASHFIWVGHCVTRIQFYDSSNAIVGQTRVVFGSNENHTRSRDSIGLCPIYDFSF